MMEELTDGEFAVVMKVLSSAAADKQEAAAEFQERGAGQSMEAQFARWEAANLESAVQKLDRVYRARQS